MDNSEPLSQPLSQLSIVEQKSFPTKLRKVKFPNFRYLGHDSCARRKQEFVHPRDPLFLQKNHKPIKLEIISCHSPVSNRRCRDAAAELICGGFHLFVEQLGHTEPNLDERKTLLRQWNRLPYQFKYTDNIRTALMWVRKFYFKQYARFDHDFTWEQMVGYLRYCIEIGVGENVTYNYDSKKFWL